MKSIFIAVAALFVGAAIGYLSSCRTIRTLRRRLREQRAGKAPESVFQSVTRLIFVTTQISALAWVNTSYGIAIYSTVVLGQVYTMSELSEPAIRTILGVGVLKVLENIFEHNEGIVFGKSKQENDSPPESGGDEAAG